MLVLVGSGVDGHEPCFTVACFFPFLRAPRDNFLFAGSAISSGDVFDNTFLVGLGLGRRLFSPRWSSHRAPN